MDAPRKGGSVVYAAIAAMIQIIAMALQAIFVM